MHHLSPGSMMNQHGDRRVRAAEGWKSLQRVQQRVSVLLNTGYNRGQGLDGKLHSPAPTNPPTTPTHSIWALSSFLFAFIEHGWGSPFSVNNVWLKSFHTTVLGHVSWQLLYSIMSLVSLIVRSYKEQRVAHSVGVQHQDTPQTGENCANFKPGGTITWGWA